MSSESCPETQLKFTNLEYIQNYTQIRDQLRYEKLWRCGEHYQDLSITSPTQRQNHVNMIIPFLLQGGLCCASLQPTTCIPPCVQMPRTQGYLQQHCTKRKEDTAWFQKVTRTALAPQQNSAASVVWENRLSVLRPPAIKSFCNIYTFF